MKTIVTHHRPDVDAIAAVWLVKTFYIGWEAGACDDPRLDQLKTTGYTLQAEVCANIQPSPPL